MIALNILLIISMGGMTQHSGATQNIDTLKKNIRLELESVNGRFGFAFKDLQDGETLFINEREMFHAASTMKTPVMIEVFRQAKEGKIQLTDSVVVKNEFRSIVDSSPYSMDIGEDSDDLVYELIGKKMTVRDLVFQMITVSSNFATNILIDILDAKKVTATMRHLGAQDIQVLRGVEDLKAYQRGLNNSTNAYDLMVVYEAIARKQVVDSLACNEMITILLDQKFRDKIPALLPPGVRVAHKTGSIGGVEHDSGIVFLPSGRKYVLVILSKELKNVEAGKRVIAQSSKLVYDYMSGKR